jgi:hypothetical protein
MRSALQVCTCVLTSNQLWAQIQATGLIAQAQWNLSQNPVGARAQGQVEACNEQQAHSLGCQVGLGWDRCFLHFP